jgi:hypothetical protein
MKDHYGNELRCPRGHDDVAVAGTAGKGQGEIYQCHACGIRFTSEAEEARGVPVPAEYEARLAALRGSRLKEGT